MMVLRKGFVTNAVQIGLWCDNGRVDGKVVITEQGLLESNQHYAEFVQKDVESGEKEYFRLLCLLKDNGVIIEKYF